MSSILTQKFFYLLQLSLGKNPRDILFLSEKDWVTVYEIAIKQSLVGIVFEGVQKLSEKGERPEASIDIVV